jgi:hypothetical protein
MCEKFNSLPDFLRPEDLISLGLYTTSDAAYWARTKGESPTFIKLGRRILYPKKAVIEFLESRMRSPHITETKNMEKKQ